MDPTLTCSGPSTPNWISCRTGKAFHTQLTQAGRIKHTAAAFPGEDGWAVYDESIGIDTMVTAVQVLEAAVREYLSAGNVA
ncbi:hypothetical protein ACNO8X_12255 [Mycobacterium sp. PDNC021]|uniref:hypothetical protein n=1 Tax=Mycobacterium sp. PDNC021 TaxID=3391399 RepID=UPI003AAECB83